MKLIAQSLFIACLIQSCLFMKADEKETQIISSHKENVLSFLNSKQIASSDFDLLMLAFKKEQILNVYAKATEEESWSKIVSYDFCTFSGTLGPKFKEGDKQIPEGFYEVDRFNPRSSFHLSLGLNYPTKRDLEVADKENPGSDIFIHGGCRSVGCIAITDEKIEELYTLAKLANPKIEVVILPFEMNEASLTAYSTKNPTHEAFWEKLFLAYKSKAFKFKN